MSQTAKHTTSMVGDLGPVSTLTLFQKYAFSVSSRAHRSIRVHTTVLTRFRLPTLKRLKTIELHVVMYVQVFAHVTDRMKTTVEPL